MSRRAHVVLDPRDGRVSPSVWRPHPRWSPPGTWPRERIFAALWDWRNRFGGPPRWSEWGAGSRPWERAYPRWPSARAVQDGFGTWNDALDAAGLPVRHRLPRFELSLAERVHAAKRFHAEGLMLRDVAALLDISVSTASAYTRARRCPTPGCEVPVIRSDARACQEHARRRPPAWTRGQLLKRHRRWSNETGTPPKRQDWAPESPDAEKWHREYPDWPSYGDVATHFATWSAFTAAAGAPPLTRHWTSAEIIEALTELAAELGRSPTAGDIANSPRAPSDPCIRVHFGSLQAAREAAGLPQPSNPTRQPRWTRERLLVALRAFAQEQGRSPRPSDWRQGGAEHPRAETVRKRFGSWPAALEAAGLHTNGPTRWSDYLILAALRDAAERLGRSPTTSDWSRTGADHPHSGTVVERFGSWNAALRAAGLEPRRPQEWPDDVILDALRRTARRLGRRPLAQDWDAGDGQHPHRCTVTERFGSWHAALEAAGID